MRNPCLRAVAVFAALLLFGRPPALAAPVDFTLDPARSAFRLGGTFNGTELGPQMPGSDVTGYAGVLRTDIDRAAGTLSIEATTAVARNQPVDQQPGAPFYDGANYGLTPVGTLPIFLAPRGMDLYVDATDARFNAGAGEGVVFFVNGGTLYFSTPERPTGVADLHGYGGGGDRTVGTVTLTREGLLETLTIPIRTQFTPYTGENGDAIVFTLAGQLIGTRVVPEPGSTALLALGGLVLLRRRARRSGASRGAGRGPR